MAWKKKGSPGRRSGTADPDTGPHGRHIAGGDARHAAEGERPSGSQHLLWPSDPLFQRAFLSRNEAKNCFLKKKKSDCGRFCNPRNTEFSVGAGDAFVRKACLIHLLVRELGEEELKPQRYITSGDKEVGISGFPSHPAVY